MSKDPRSTRTVYRRHVPSRLEEVDAICRDLRPVFESRGWASLSFGFELVLRECLNNAILHGNREDPAKRVDLILEDRGRWVRVQVGDEGPGFDWRTTRARNLPDGEATNGRGLPIAGIYTRRLRFNPAGNRITLWFRQPVPFQPPSNAMIANTIDRQAGVCRVRVEGDLTASHVAGWQAALKRELEQPLVELVVDLAGTGMLDSSGIGLLIATYNSVARRGGRFRIENASPAIFQLLASMRLTGRLQVSESKSGEVAHG